MSGDIFNSEYNSWYHSVSFRAKLNKNEKMEIWSNFQSKTAEERKLMHSRLDYETFPSLPEFCNENSPLYV